MLNIFLIFSISASTMYVKKLAILLHEVKATVKLKIVSIIYELFNKKNRQDFFVKLGMLVDRSSVQKYKDTLIS